jgi:hypothetical protein
MDELAARHRIAAWKTYTQWGPDGNGFFMDDEPGLKLIEKARALGHPQHRHPQGAAVRARSYEHSTCVDSAGSPSATPTSTSSSTTPAR